MSSSSSSVSSNPLDFDVNDWEVLLRESIKEPEEDSLKKTSKEDYYLDLSKKLSKAKDEVDRSPIFADSEKSIVIFGYTGVGKSALINLIAGKTLFTKFNRYGKSYIEVEDQLENCKVGQERHSETKRPEKWDSKEGISYWDTPGFDDNRGIVQEYQNAKFIEKLIGSSKELKIIFMIKESDITEKSGRLFPMVKLISTIFNDKIDQIKDSISLVVSNTPLSIDKEHIHNAIDDTLNDSEIHFTKDETQLLTSLSNNITIFNNEIGNHPHDFKKDGVFCKAAKLEDIKDTLFENINKMKFASNIGKINYPISLAVDISAIKKSYEEDIKKIDADLKNMDGILQEVEKNVAETNKSLLAKELLQCAEDKSRDDEVKLKEFCDIINKYVDPKIENLLHSTDTIHYLNVFKDFMKYDSNIKFTYKIFEEINNKMIDFAKKLDPTADTKPAIEATRERVNDAIENHKKRTALNNLLTLIKGIFSSIGRLFRK